MRAIMAVSFSRLRKPSLTVEHGDRLFSSALIVTERLDRPETLSTLFS